MTAVPTAPANWRTVLFTAEPCDANSRGNGLRAAVLSRMVINAKPIHKTIVRITINEIDVVLVKSSTKNIDTAINAVPAMNRGFAPNLSNNFPAVGERKALITAPESKINPATNAVNSRPFCR